MESKKQAKLTDKENRLVVAGGGGGEAGQKVQTFNYTISHGDIMYSIYL